jgi:hypothetical protein
MELLSRLRWLFIIFFVVLFLILVGWGLSTIARNIFSTGSSGDQQVEESALLLNDTDTTKLLVSGPVVASSEHRSYTIEVNPNVVILTLYSDYEQKELEQKSYRNNQESFDVFIKALESVNIASRIRGTDTEDDLRYEGECPTSRRYVVTIDSDFQRWSTACSRTPGTIDPARMSSVRRLFNAQAPDAQEVLKGTNLLVN